MQSSWPPAPWSVEHFSAMARRTGPLARPVRQTDDDAQDAESQNQSISSHTTSSVIKVTVGTYPDQRVHYLHKAILMEKSNYFAACLNQPMVESDTPHVRLPEVAPHGFDFFVNWAYTGIVTPGLTLDDYLVAYILADKLMMSTNDYVNCIIRAFCRVIDQGREDVTTDHITYLAENGLSESNLMGVAIQKFAYSIAQENVANYRPTDYEWMNLLGMDPVLTLCVLGELKVEWQEVALESVAASSVTRDSGSADSAGAARATKRPRVS